VCVDCQPAWSQRAGIGRAVRGLAEHLPAARDGDELVLFSFGDERGLADPRARGLHERVVPFPPGRLVRRLWRSADVPPYDWFAGPADVYHFTNYACPPLSRGRSVVTVYDTSFLRFPETVEPRNLAFVRSQVRRTARRADVVLATSDFAAAAISSGLGVEPDRIRAIPPGLDAMFATPAADGIEALRFRFGLARPYLLSVGTVEPRKNLAFLADVFDAATWFDGDLVLAGALGWKYEPILDRLQAARRSSAIRLLQGVGDDALPALYAGAEAFLFPSIDEGFGFPPLEAMACGTPVVASAGGALPEVLGEAARIVQGFDVDAWSDATRSVVEDAAERARRVALGHTRTALYSWETAARRTWAVYRALAG
jgi:glycosyltransferase involved in cell wall biosynthesis